MVFEVFFPAPTTRDKELWELIEMIQIDKDASVLEDSVETIPEVHPESPPYTSERTSLTETSPSPISASTRSYGTTQRLGDDLIDLESGRSYSIFSLSSNPAHLIAASTLHPEFGCAASSVDSDDTLVPSEVSVDDLLAELLAIRPKSTKYLKHTVLIIMLFWTIIFAIPLPEQVSLSAPLTDHTPLSVGCVIPPVEYTSADLIHLSQTVSARVKLVIWPDDLVVNTDWQRDVLVEDVHRAIGIQYGVWTLISVLVNETGVKERILVGPEGGVRPGEGGTDWTVYLPP